MAMKKITYEDAVERLDNYIQAKTTHPTKGILDTMRYICALKFVSEEDQNDFAQTCTHFEMYVNETGKTSIGRKQFEQWWEVGGTALIEDNDLHEDPLPQSLVNEDSEPCMKAHTWRVGECPYCRIQELEAVIKEVTETLERYKRIR